ncbi:DUF350 domain-containing protein [bacterium]|nr:DUF350 domain-containing protein [bacterium]
MNLIDALNTATYLAEAFLLFLAGKAAYKLINPQIKIGHTLVEDDNTAFAISMVGYYAGIITAISGSIIGPSHGMLNDIIDIGIYGLLAIILLNLSAIINDKLIFNRFAMKKEIITDRNIGAGVIEAANYLATGIIVYGAIIGEYGGILSAVFYWLAGQLLFMIAAWVYNFITPYNIHDQIEKDNVAVGVGFAGALVAVAILVETGLANDEGGWQTQALNVLIDCTIGFIFLPIARFLTDKILLPGRNLTDEIVNQEQPNVGAALIEAFAYIGGAVLISWTL